MGGSKGSGGGKSSSKIEPWSGAEPYLSQILSEAQNLYQQGAGTSYYPGQTYIDPSRDTLAAQAAIRNRALSGSPLLGAAEQNLTGTLQGDYLSAGNPYFEQMAGRITDQVLPNLQGMFGAAGRAGSAGNAEAVARGLGDSIGALAYQNFSDERGRQMQGLGMAPAMEAAGYMPAQQLGLLGQQVEGYEGQRLASDIQRYNAQEGAPWDLLSRYAGIASPLGGLGTVSQSKQNGNLMGDMLSGAQTVASIAALFSSRDAKEVIGEVDGAEALDAIRGLEVGRWRYRPDAVPGDQAEHVGPYAEDFAKAFGAGDGKTISVIDALGVLFAAVKELAARLDAKEAA